MLSLAEEIFLLSLLEKKDSVRIPSSMSTPFLLTGAVIMELILAGSLRIENSRLIPAAMPEEIPDERMRYVLEKISQADKPRRLEQWVYIIGAKGKRLSKGIIQTLIDKSILLEEGNYYRWVAGQNGRCLPGSLSKYMLKREIRDAVFCEGAINERTAIRLGLLDACEMLDHLFTKDEMVAVRKQIKSLKRQEQFSAEFGEVLSQLTGAIEYAIAAAVSA